MPIQTLSCRVHCAGSPMAKLHSQMCWSSTRNVATNPSGQMPWTKRTEAFPLHVHLREHARIPQIQTRLRDGVVQSADPKPLIRCIALIAEMSVHSNCAVNANFSVNARSPRIPEWASSAAFVHASNRARCHCRHLVCTVGSASTTNNRTRRLACGCASSCARSMTFC